MKKIKFQVLDPQQIYGNYDYILSWDKVYVEKCTHQTIFRYEKEGFKPTPYRCTSCGKEFEAPSMFPLPKDFKKQIKVITKQEPLKDEDIENPKW